uniref:HEPN domain-containing protein n=1 Tax=Thermodesulfobacterium geofontis TaxID=1295609 RepID=A0A7V5XH28_9BACT
MINEEAKKWLIKAINDYKSAQKLLSQSEEEIITDTACFHCQQAVEKMLKAFLINHDIEFGRTHSIEYLIKLCSKVDKEFEKLYEITEGLTEYAVDVRYPEEFYIPSVEEAKEALNAATKVKEFVLRKLKIDEKDLKPVN